MALPSSGAITFAQIAAELYNDSNRAISLNENLVRILAGVPSGTVSLSNFYGKKGNYVASKQYSGNYGWSPPTSIYFNETGNSGTTSGNYQGTLNKSGELSSSQGAWVDTGVTFDVATVTRISLSDWPIGKQVGPTSGPSAEDPYEYGWFVIERQFIGSGSSSAGDKFRIRAMQRRRLLTFHQSYSGAVWLRG